MKISDLPSTDTVSSDALIPIVQSGSNYKATVAELFQGQVLVIRDNNGVVWKLVINNNVLGIERV